MEVKDFNTKYADLFGNPEQKEEEKSVNFGNKEDINTVDLFAPDKKEEVIVDPKKDQKSEGEEDKDTKVGESKIEADILNLDSKSGPGRKPKNNFEDIAGYFKDRIEKKKFVPITQTADDGKVVPFLPSTPEEFDEVLDLQVNYKLEEAKKDLEKKWYQSKSAAWQAVAQYSELVDDPSEILPFIQGVNNIQSVDKFNEEDLGDAEQIVRIRLRQKGENEDVIEDQIEALKTTDKLTSTAKKLKPIILQGETQRLEQMKKQEEEQRIAYLNMVRDYRNKAITAIDSTAFGKQKLKQDEKIAIYDLIGQPQQETQGYGIYNAIDELFEKEDFSTLAQVALFLTHRDSFTSYLNNLAANKTAESLQTKLRLSTETKLQGAEPLIEETQTIDRNHYSSGRPRFGR